MPASPLFPSWLHAMPRGLLLMQVITPVCTSKLCSCPLGPKDSSPHKAQQDRSRFPKCSTQHAGPFCLGLREVQISTRWGTQASGLKSRVRAACPHHNLYKCLQLSFPISFQASFVPLKKPSPRHPPMTTSKLGSPSHTSVRSPAVSKWLNPRNSFYLFYCYLRKLLPC